jgi:hypothetical protein
LILATGAASIGQASAPFSNKGVLRVAIEDESLEVSDANEPEGAAAAAASLLGCEDEARSKSSTVISAS